ncbi:hypothetical protein SAMN05216316_0175 [Nitrosovibrio sp. Nv6]|nr:hypothetical protein SAMN05216316_0175 [Nitrosovibrio sp. Nv6]
MTKRQGQLYFVVCTFLAAANFIGMTIHSHTRFAEITDEDKLTSEERCPLLYWMFYEINKDVSHISDDRRTNNRYRRSR